MRISRHHRHWQPRAQEPQYPVNQFIRAPEVRVIDEENANLGVMPTPQALALAVERGYDLVAVTPKAVPPVCRFLDYGKFKYEKEKEVRKQKAHSHRVEVKGVRLSVRIGEHDLDVRREKGRDFLREGDKVQIEMILRGREKQHTDLARKVMEDFAAKLGTPEMPTKIEQPFDRQGGRLTMIIARA